MYTHTPVVVKASKVEAKKIVVYILAFLSALHITPATYINSSFLGQFVSDEKVGLIFTVSSIIVLALYAFIKDLLGKYGNYRVFIAAITVDIASLVIMSSSLLFTDPRFGPLFIVAYIFGHVSRVLMILNLDIFLEHLSTDKDTGGIRGVYLTSLNISYVIGPLIASKLIADVELFGTSASAIAIVYVWGIALLIPIILIARKHFRDFADNTYRKGKVIDILRRVSQHRDLVRICCSNFILSFFYSWMIIYTPIFLGHIGFPLDQVVFIIGLALIPFVFLQIPAGKIADKYWGEKEMLTLGFLIAAGATAAMTFIHSNEFWVWVGILFVTRIGASIIESMNETYLFKKITDGDIDILSLYKSISEAAYMIAPIVASLLLAHIFDIQYLFVVLGVILLYGIRFSLTIKDTL